jgi:hypothetical protein
MGRIVLYAYRTIGGKLQREEGSIAVVLRKLRCLPWTFCPSVYVVAMPYVNKEQTVWSHHNIFNNYQSRNISSSKGKTTRNH